MKISLNIPIHKGFNYGLAVGVTAFSMMFTGSAVAQQSAVAIEEVFVTGSRIRSSAVTASSPLQQVDAEMIEDLGALDLIDVLQVNPTFGIAGASRTVSDDNITSAGASIANLRGLGADRTLVLVDGRRMIAGQPGTSQVDLNMIPTDFVERVDVLTGGASAIYGSDAVAGVVNFAYKTDFEGVIFNAQAGASAEGDDDQTKFSITAGQNFAGDRGNFMVHASFSEQGRVSNADRVTHSDDWTSLGHGARDPSQLFEWGVGRSGHVPMGVMNGYIFDNNNDASPFSGTQEDRFNRAEYRGIASEVDRINFATRATYDFSDSITAFTEATYGRIETAGRFEPTPLWIGAGSASNFLGYGAGAPINLENRMFNPADGATQLVRNPYIPDIIYNAASDTNNDGLLDGQWAQRITQFGTGTRDIPIQRDSFRLVGGFEGELNDDWVYDVHASYGRTTLNGRMTGLVNMPNLQAALNVGVDVFDLDNDGDFSDAVCVDADARARGCIPVNIYGDSNMTPEMLEYVEGELTQNSEQEMYVVAANVSGSLVELPAGQMLMAAGLEYRKENSTHLFDALTNSTQNGYLQQTDTVGELDVTEAYAEVSVPLITGAPGFESLSIRGAARISNYSTVGSVSAFDGAIEWTPFEGLRFRAVHAQAVRAPNIGELFSAPALGVLSITDPCLGVTNADTTSVAQNCRAEAGVQTNIDANGSFTGTQYDRDAVVDANLGNLGVGEEASTTNIFGFVYTPSFVQGLVVTADYFDIELDEAVTRITPSDILTKCYSEGIQEFCNFVDRRTTSEGGDAYSEGSVRQITSGLINSGGTYTEGFDVTASYSHQALGGDLSYAISWTHLLDKGTISQDGATASDETGEIGNAEDRWFATLNYDKDALGISVSGQYVGDSYLNDAYWMARFGADADKESFKVDGVLYIDAQVKYQFGDSYEFYLGAKNLFDEESGLYKNNNFSHGVGTYDYIGRRWYTGVRVSF